MRKSFYATIVAYTITATIWPALANAEPTYIQKMNGLPAVCSIEDAYQQTEVDAAAKKYGEGKPGWSKAFQVRLDAVRTCLDSARDKGKAFYRDEIAKHPDLKPQLSDMYVAWLAHLDHFIDDERDGYERAYEKSANRLQAEIDAR